jgi:hypothetical protein
MASALAKNLLTYWAIIENEKIFLVSLEIGTAAVLIILFSYVRRGWEAGKLARVATSAGLVMATPFRGLAWQQLKKLKTSKGFTQDIMIIGSTGLRTFAEPGGELHQVVRNCREAKIMLLTLSEKGQRPRHEHPGPGDHPKSFRSKSSRASIFSKGQAAQKNIRLKLYPTCPC